MVKEGNLEAPTRHALGWKNTDFYNEEKCFDELERTGTYGVKKGSHEMAMRIGKPVFKAMVTMKDGSEPDFISSDCPLGHPTLPKALRSMAWVPPN